MKFPQRRKGMIRVDGSVKCKYVFEFYLPRREEEYVCNYIQCIGHLLWSLGDAWDLPVIWCLAGSKGCIEDIGQAGWNRDGAALLHSSRNPMFHKGKNVLYIWLVAFEWGEQCRGWKENWQTKNRRREEQNISQEEALLTKCLAQSRFLRLEWTFEVNQGGNFCLQKNCFAQRRVKQSIPA